MWRSTAGDHELLKEGDQGNPRHARTEPTDPAAATGWHQPNRPLLNACMGTGVAIGPIPRAGADGGGEFQAGAVPRGDEQRRPQGAVAQCTACRVSVALRHMTRAGAGARLAHLPRRGWISGTEAPSRPNAFLRPDTAAPLCVQALKRCTARVGGVGFAHVSARTRACKACRYGRRGVQASVRKRCAPAAAIGCRRSERRSASSSSGISRCCASGSATRDMSAPKADRPTGHAAAPEHARAVKAPLRVPFRWRNSARGAAFAVASACGSAAVSVTALTNIDMR